MEVPMKQSPHPPIDLNGIYCHLRFTTTQRRGGNTKYGSFGDKRTFFHIAASPKADQGMDIRTKETKFAHASKYLTENTLKNIRKAYICVLQTYYPPKK